MSDALLATVRVVHAGEPLREAVRRAGGHPGAEAVEAATRARIGPLPLADLTDEGGWLARLTGITGAPLALLPQFVAAPRRLAGVPVTESTPAWELDAFAVASVYETVVWDDRAAFWHRDSGRDDSATLLRALHDLALRAYRNHDEGERLVVLAESP